MNKKKYLIVILTTFVLHNSAFLQRKYDTLLFFNETFISLNKSIVLEKTYKGYYGIDLGVRDIILDKKPINFVYGLGFSYTHFYFDYYIDPTPSHFIEYYKNVYIDNYYITNSFDLRINFGKKRRIYLESGVFLDFKLRKKSTGMYFRENSFPNPSTVEKFVHLLGAPIMIGPSLGLGYTLFFNTFELTVESEIKFYGIKDLPSYYYLQNMGYWRFGLSFRKLKEIK